ncbi:hypothetical protein VNO78_10050 [Psophocarpus tetragonolobus]|uniref:Uncharacterized protein n=1 Tax=Psophocarpus tetragonolobus TaxID=3891 RepID=A0AAN9XM65_PSOTE
MCLKKKMEKEKEADYMGFAVHSQVMKIKEEIEKIKHPSLQLHISRPLLRDVNSHRSRSPLAPRFARHAYP